MISNAFVMNGGVIKRQTIGLPMGTNCAPNLANLYLYSYESTFIDRLVAVKGTSIGEQFHMSFRLIDDTLSIDNPHWRVYAERKYESVPADGIGGIYPAALALNNTTVVPDREVTFLGIRIRDLHGKLVLSVYDKRAEFPFNVLRYPHMCSVIPSSIPYGVLTGQLHRLHRICSRTAHFVKEARKVVSILREQGCALHRLTHVLEQFLERARPNAYQWRREFRLSNRTIVARIMRSGRGSFA